MPKENINARQVFDKHYCLARSRFRAYFDDPAEIENCMAKTEQLFKGGMELYCITSEAEATELLKIAVGKVTTGLLLDKKLRRENSPLNRVRRQAMQAVREGVDFRQLAFRLMSGIRVPRLRQQPAALK